MILLFQSFEEDNVSAIRFILANNCYLSFAVLVVLTVAFAVIDHCVNGK